MHEYAEICISWLFLVDKAIQYVMQVNIVVIAKLINKLRE